MHDASKLTRLTELSINFFVESAKALQGILTIWSYSPLLAAVHLGSPSQGEINQKHYMHVRASQPSSVAVSKEYTAVYNFASSVMLTWACGHYTAAFAHVYLCMCSCSMPLSQVQHQANDLKPTMLEQLQNKQGQYCSMWVDPPCCYFTSQLCRDKSGCCTTMAWLCYWYEGHACNKTLTQQQRRFASQPVNFWLCVSTCASG